MQKAPVQVVVVAAMRFVSLFICVSCYCWKITDSCVYVLKNQGSDAVFGWVLLCSADFFEQKNTEAAPGLAF
jgi:hypothetical protein